MNINGIENETQKVPVMAHLSDVSKLYDLARDKDPSARIELSKVIGSILKADVSPRESELVADVLIKLMRQAESDLRKAVSEQISVLDDVPLRLVLQLANDDIDIARPILTSSNILSDVDLMYLIKAKTTEYWQAIAEREVLNAEVIDILADTKDFDTALVLVENNNIILTDHALVALSDIAQNSELLALPLLRRDEVSSDFAKCLYEYVGEEIKLFINKNYNIDEVSVSNAIDEVVDEFSEPEEPKEFAPDDHMMAAAESFKDKDMLDMALMLSTLRLGHIRSFIAQFSVYVDIPVEIIYQVLSQKNGKGLAIAAKAFDIKKQDFISMFMLSSELWNNGRLVSMNDIRAATAYYNKATPELSLRIIKGTSK